MKKHLWALVALAGVASAHAGDLSYSYFEGGFSRMDIDGIDTGDGYFVGGSLGIGANWLGFAEWSTASFDESGVNADVDELQIGFGGHFAMSDRADFVGRLAYVDESVDVSSALGSGSASENGYMVSAGIRGRALERLDLMGSIEYVDLGDAGDDTGFSFRGVYDFTEMFSLGARIGYSDDTNEYGVFGRVRF